jgi:1-deoxy-D-xylulose-5-phosphate reductoisomerase
MVTGGDPRPAPPKTVTILGATGSIGTSALAVIAAQPGRFAVEAVTANSNAERLAAIARRAGARLAAVGDPAAYAALKAALAGSGIEAAAGEEAVREAATRPADIVVAAIVGAAGLAPTFAAIEAGARIALANKECLVCAGDLFMAEARRHAAAILPVDSEHNAVHQLLAGRPADDIARVVLTASGGPFRTASREAMAAATPTEALKHPNWSMGPKITIDSATLMNKGLEVIEAHHIFGLPSDRLEVLVHPQSVVHGMVVLKDGALLAHMSAPDMKAPIAYCLAWPERSPVETAVPDLAALGSLTFAAPDPGRFPALRLAREALDAGVWATNILNAANEIAVAAFLAGGIGFLEIAGLVEDTIAAAVGRNLTRTPKTVDEALALDREARRIATGLATRREAV